MDSPSRSNRDQPYGPGTFPEGTEAAAFQAMSEGCEGEPKDVPLARAIGVARYTQDVAGNGDTKSKIPDHWGKDILADLSRGFRCFYSFQDLLEFVRSDWNASQGYPIPTNHCYYESVMYLRASLHCLLDGHFKAAMNLLRPFAELAIMHLYWESRASAGDCRIERKRYDSWLATGEGAPRFSSAVSLVYRNLRVRDVVPKAKLVQRERVLRVLYGKLCSYCHAPRPTESLTAMEGNAGQLVLFPFIYAAEFARFTLRAVIYTYILSFPLCVFPIEMFSKGGFLYAQFMFFDGWGAKLLRFYLGDKNTDELITHFRRDKTVIEVLEHLERMPVLSEAEMEQEWALFAKSPETEFATRAASAKTLSERIGRAKARVRSVRWALNYLPYTASRDRPSDEQITEAERLRTLAMDW